MASVDANAKAGRRSSARASKSRLVMHHGVPVLRENMVRLRGGTYEQIEPNEIWEEETNNVGGEGLHGPANGQIMFANRRSTGSAPREPAAKRARTTAPKKILTEAERRRLAHKAEIEADCEKAASQRAAFLMRHAKVFRPFVRSKVAAQIESQDTEPLAPAPFIEAQPELLDQERGCLRDYQMESLNWMATMHARGMPMILGDEMGLGKTLQTIALLAYLKESLGQAGPSLIVCPLSVISSWKHEIETWAPSFKFLIMHASDSETRMKLRRQFLEAPESLDVVVTTYSHIKLPDLKNLWQRHHFRFVVLDEGHEVKNATSGTAMAVRHLHSHNKLILTGTPLQNNLSELWSILNYMLPDVFDYSEPFDEAFDIAANQIDHDVLAKAHKLMELLMLRRLKTRVESKLPPKVETIIKCPLSRTQLFWYRGLLLRDLSTLANLDDVEKGAQVVKQPSKHNVLSNLVMQLRKCANHPYLFAGAEPSHGATTARDLAAASGKLAVLDMLLRELKKRGHRVVLFSQFVRTLDIIEDFLELRGYPFVRFDGSNSKLQRATFIKRFNAPESPELVFLMTTRSGGMGINLQTADTCILFDSDWNPAGDLQAQARVHRIGQTKPVHVYRLVTDGSVEERIVERAQKKMFLDKLVVQGDTSGSGAADDFTVGTSELLSAIRVGADAIFAGKSGALPSAAHISTLVNRSETTATSDAKSDCLTAPAPFDPSKELTSTTKLQGVDFALMRAKMDKSKAPAVRNISDLGEMWRNLSAKRERKSRIVMVDGTGSGYGSALVPVLASNNYDLDSGEKSVFCRELAQSGQATVVEELTPADTPMHRKHCIKCLEPVPKEESESQGVLWCSSCPSAKHDACCDFREPMPKSRSKWLCHLHRCTDCDAAKFRSDGLLFPCYFCAKSYCVSCLPDEDVTLLGPLPGFRELGFSRSYFDNECYVLCSMRCKKKATAKLGWSPEVSSLGGELVDPFDLSEEFSGLDCTDMEGNPEEPAQPLSRKSRRGRKTAAPAPTAAA